jgi:hypothetical protein
MDTYGSSSGTYTSTEPTKVPEIKLVVDQLEKEIFRLDDELKGLEGRLAHVTLPEPPINAKAVRDERQPHSEFYNHLAALCERLGGLNNYLSDIKGRLEL